MDSLVERAFSRWAHLHVTYPYASALRAYPGERISYEEATERAWNEAIDAVTEEFERRLEASRRGESEGGE